MPRRLGSAEIIRVLEANGFSFISQRGSHVKYRSAHGRTAIVPHQKRGVPIGTPGSIIRRGGLPPKVLGFCFLPPRFSAAGLTAAREEEKRVRGGFTRLYT